MVKFDAQNGFKIALASSRPSILRAWTEGGVPSQLSRGRGVSPAARIAKQAQATAQVSPHIHPHGRRACDDHARHHFARLSDSGRRHGSVLLLMAVLFESLPIVASK